MHVYCSGIGGVGIGPLAMLALDAGYNVDGSDVVETPMTRALADRGMNVAIVQDDSHIAQAHAKQPIEWFVYTAAWTDDHPELVFAREHGIKMSKRDEFINEVIQKEDLQLIAVSGTHGKTTVTGMITWLFKQLGTPVSYAVGTTISFGPAAQYQKGSQYFVYECDEFDRNFLHFRPSLAVIPSIDYDHVDTYPTIEDYRYAFADFVRKSSQTLLWQNDANDIDLNDSTSVEVLSESDPGVQTITLPGEHNRRNAWLAVQAVHELFPEHSVSDLVKIVSAFPGTNRRMEKLGEGLYTDYAHHPTEIAATIQAARELGSDVVIVYQPHQNIRQHELLKHGGYQDAFAGASHVYWLPTYLSREYKDMAVLEPAALIKSVSNSEACEPAEMDDALWQNIQQQITDGKTVVAMAAGDLDAWLRKRAQNT